MPEIHNVPFDERDNGKDNRVAARFNTAFSLLIRPQRLTDYGSSDCYPAIFAVGLLE